MNSKAVIQDMMESRKVPSVSSLEAGHPVEAQCADAEFWQRNGMLSSDGQSGATNEISTSLPLDGSCFLHKGENERN